MVCIELKKFIKNLILCFISPSTCTMTLVLSTHMYVIINYMFGIIKYLNYYFLAWLHFGRRFKFRFPRIIGWLHFHYYSSFDNIVHFLEFTYGNFHHQCRREAIGILHKPWKFCSMTLSSFRVWILQNYVLQSHVWFIVCNNYHLWYGMCDTMWCCYATSHGFLISLTMASPKYWRLWE